MIILKNTFFVVAFFTSYAVLLVSLIQLFYFEDVFVEKYIKDAQKIFSFFAVIYYNKSYVVSLIR